MNVSRCYEVPISEIERCVKIFAEENDMELYFNVMRNKVKLVTSDYKNFDFYKITQYFYSSLINEHFVINDMCYLLGRGRVNKTSYNYKRA